MSLSSFDPRQTVSFVVKGVPPRTSTLKSVPVSTSGLGGDHAGEGPGVQGGGGRHRPRHHPSDVRQLRVAKVEWRPIPRRPNTQPHVATLNTDSARTIAELMGTVDTSHAGEIPDVIMSDDLIGGVLLQVSANPSARVLRRALLATEGHERYIRDADLYGGADTRASTNVESDTGGDTKGLERVWKAKDGGRRCGGVSSW